MFAPFVLPEGLISSSIVFPVGIHVVEKVGGAGGGDDGTDIGVSTAGITVGIESAIAVIRPQAMDGPRVSWTFSRTGVPELCLQNKLSAMWRGYIGWAPSPVGGLV